MLPQPLKLDISMSSSLSTGHSLVMAITLILQVLHQWSQLSMATPSALSHCRNLVEAASHAHRIPAMQQSALHRKVTGCIWICREGTPSNLSHGGNQREAGVGGPAGEGGVGRLRSFGLEEGTLGDRQQQRRSVLSAHRLAVDLVQVQPRPGAEDTLSER